MFPILNPPPSCLPIPSSCCLLRNSRIHPTHFILFLPSGFLPCMLMVPPCAGYFPFPSLDSYSLLFCSLPVQGAWWLVHGISWAFLVAGFLYVCASQSRGLIPATSPSRKKRCHRVWLVASTGFPASSVGKESACNTGNPGLIAGLGRSAGEGIGYPLPYSWASLVAQLIKNLPAMQETWV